MAKMKNKMWSNSEDNLLIRSLKKGLTTAETAKVLGRTPAAVGGRKHTLIQNGQLEEGSRFSNSEQKRKVRQWKDFTEVEQKNILSHYDSATGMKGLAEKFNIDGRSLRFVTAPGAQPATVETVATVVEDTNSTTAPTVDSILEGVKKYGLTAQLEVNGVKITIK
jgi:hypothetical protein